MKSNSKIWWTAGLLLFSIAVLSVKPTFDTVAQIPANNPVKDIPIQSQIKVIQTKKNDSANIEKFKSKADVITKLSKAAEESARNAKIDKLTDRAERLSDKIERQSDEIAAYKSAYLALLKKRNDDQHLLAKIDSLKCIIDSFPKQITVYDTVPFVFRAKLKHELKDTIIKKITIKIP